MAHPYPMPGLKKDGTALKPRNSSVVSIELTTGEVSLFSFTFTHNFGAAAVTKAMIAAESRASFITVSNASGNVELNIPAALPGKTWLVHNGSGHILTFQVVGGSGPTLANTKYGFYTCHATEIIEIWEQA